MKNQKGYTLVELMATLGLSTMIAGGFFLAVEGLLIISTWRRFRAKGGVSALLPRIEPVVLGVVTMTFVSAFLYQLFLRFL